MEQNARTLAVMLEALDQIDAPHAVFGGLLAVLYGKRQRTGDVDMLVPGSSFGRLKAAFEQRGYEVRQHRYFFQILRRGEPRPVGDLVIAESTAALRAAFTARNSAQILGQAVCAVPRGEFVALQFEASVRSRRLTRDQRSDVYDIAGVLERGFGPQDERAALQLARTMFPGAEADLASLLDDLRHGCWPRVVIRARMRTALLHRQAALALRR